MYFTMKIRIKMVKEKEGYLLLYERLYHEQMERLLRQMQQSGNVMFSQLQFDKSINPNSRWQLYCLVLKKYKAAKTEKTFQYERSSTWNLESFSYRSRTLKLLFGASFPIQDCMLSLSMDTCEDEYLKRNRIVRLDLVHDEKFWYANFTLHKNNG